MEGSAIIFVEGENGKSESSKKFDLDDFLDDMGDISRHQVLSAIGIIATLVCGVSLMTLTPIFFSATPPHRCAFKLENQISNISNTTQSMIISKIIPKFDNKKYDSCHRYDYDLAACEARSDLSCLDNATAKSVMKCDEGYDYDRSIYKESVVTEWDLVCDRKILDSLSNSLFFLGFLLGSILSGILGDWCGRRLSMLIFCVGHLGFGFGAAFAQSFLLYLILRIGVAATTVGAVLVAFVYIGEISNNKWRTDLLLFVSLGGALSNVIIAALAFAFRDWRNLEIVCSVAALTYIPIFFLTYESPRWLLSVGRENEARDVIETYCNSKGSSLDEDKWELVLKSQGNQGECEPIGKRYSIIDLFRYPHMRILSLNVMFSWFASSLVFYGLILNVGNLAGDPYVNTAINSSMDIIAAASIYILIRYIPKRNLLCAAYVLAGTSCLGSMFFQQMNFVRISVALACVGRLGVSSSYKIIYLITSDLYPTVARGIGMSLGSMTARIGGMLSPFTVQAQESIPWLMQTLYGSLGLIAGILGVLYPDTTKSRLMTTLEEAEQFCAENMPRICNAGNRRRRKSDADEEGLSTKMTECSESDILSSTSSPMQS